MITAFSPLLPSQKMQAPSSPRSDELHPSSPYPRRPSLTPAEMVFLSALLIDPPEENELVACSQDQEITERMGQTTIHDAKAPSAPSTEPSKNSPRVLDSNILFSLPQEGISLNSSSKKKHRKVTKDPRQYRFMVGLWQAHEDGVPPNRLSSFNSTTDVPEDSGKASGEEDHVIHEAAGAVDPNEDEMSEKSDIEVRGEQSDDSSDVSWEDEVIKNHFDAWQVLKDEYAKDFGFDYTPHSVNDSNVDDDIEPNTFRILGTSAEDTSSHPHVLSPPLMDAIMNFLPDHLRGQNMWMKYSLVRDGASLETFKQYSRASKDSILAIETTKGHVFGCYASQPWRTAPSFYGGVPSFIFKMRHNRNTPCHSLIEQAEMEGEIDLYFLLDKTQRPQVCTRNLIGIGEGSVQKYNQNGEIIESEEEDAEISHGKNFGFAIALNDDLLSGTTSKCSSYQNPCLVDASSNGEMFEVLNLELWTLTPCFSLDSAEKLEMSQYFVQQSLRNLSVASSRSSSTTRTNDRSSIFSSQDLDRDHFYRRIGHGDEHEELREQWHYRNMMDEGGGIAGPRGMGASPRFNNSTT